MIVERHFKLLGLLWLIFGGGISVSLAVSLFQLVIRFGFDITDPVDRSFLIALPANFVAFLSGWGLFKRKPWGRIAIIVISLIYIVYGFLYILFGGAEDEGIVTTTIVLCLLVLGLYSFFFLLITGERKGNIVN